MARTRKNALALTMEILRSEGIQSVVNRIRDRGSDWIRYRNLGRIDGLKDISIAQMPAPPVLNVSAIPPAPRRGGSQIQMLDRLDREKHLRSVAFAYLRGNGISVEFHTTESSGRLSLEATENLADTLAMASRLSGTEIVHIENLHGFPFQLIGDLEQRGIRTILSIHDFTFFCRRPHLIDSTTGKFCHYSTEADRCRRCLQYSEHGPEISQEDYRRIASDSLTSTSAIIYPSVFLKTVHHKLFPRATFSRIEEVISPATSRSPQGRKKKATPCNIAFVGGFFTHKGGALIRPVMEQISAQFPHATGHVYGNGERHLAHEIRSLKSVRLRGYYRKNGLQGLLYRDRVGVVVFPSIWPEAYGLVVDECLAAGVPVVAFDLGAVGERFRGWNMDHLVPIELGAEGLANKVVDLLSNPSDVPQSVINSIPNPAGSARQHLSLYSRLS